MKRFHGMHADRWRAARLALILATAPLAALAFSSAGTAAPTPGSADLRITKTDSPDPAHVGATLTYSIGVDNVGPDAASGVVVTDTLPNGVDFVSASATGGSCSHQGRKVSCPLGSVGVGVNYGAPAGATIAVIPRQAGTITNTASVDGDQKDPVAKNNKATASTRVLGSVSCRGVAATVTGTPGNDVLNGTEGPDVIVGLGGSDRIVAMSGRDLVCAGAGNDYIAAGSALDRVFAGVGRDRLLGRGGSDQLSAGGGNDLLKGGRGADRLRGGRGFDTCRGGPGIDSIRGCER
jgi:uncharacterized repeat protein (TIGR01451 family)